MSRERLPSEEIRDLRMRNAALCGLLRRIQRLWKVDGDTLDEAIEGLSSKCSEVEARRREER